MVSKTLLEEKATNKRNKMLDEFGKAKVVFQLPLWGVFHREPSFVPQTTPLHCSRAHQTAGQPLLIDLLGLAFKITGIKQVYMKNTFHL